MATDYNVIGERIRNARKARKMTQQDLAEELGVSIAFLSRVERGNSQINLKRISQICGILGISEGELLNGTSSTSSSYLDGEFSDILKKCNDKQVKLIYDIAKLIANQNN